MRIQNLLFTLNMFKIIIGRERGLSNMRLVKEYGLYFMIMQETLIKGHFTNSLCSEIWGLSKGIFYWDFWIINFLYYGIFCLCLDIYEGWLNN